MLNKLRHCTSWNTVTSHETTLAQLQLVKGADEIPPDVAKKAPTGLL